MPVMTGNPNFARMANTNTKVMNIQNRSPKSGVSIAGKFNESI
jgi:hypothetical protein